MEVGYGNCPETGFWEVQTVCRLCASFHITGEERDETNRLTAGQPTDKEKPLICCVL